MNLLDSVLCDDELREAYHLLRQREMAFAAAIAQVRSDQSAARQHGDITKADALETILSGFTPLLK